MQGQLGARMPTRGTPQRVTVPCGEDSGDLVCVLPQGHAKDASEAKVRKFDVQAAVQQEILGLEVSVQHSVVVAEGHAYTISHRHPTARAQARECMG